MENRDEATCLLLFFVFFVLFRGQIYRGFGAVN